MSKKRLHSRIESFFTGLAQEGISAPLPTDSGIPTSQRTVPTGPGCSHLNPAFPTSSNTRPFVWYWETDASLTYTVCSPEVNEALHIPPQEFLGKSILTCAVHPAAQE